MMMRSRRLTSGVPALAVWFDSLSPAEDAQALGLFLVARFAGRAAWIIADGTRDAYLPDDALPDRVRVDGTLEVARTEQATLAMLFGLPQRTGFSWDGWLIVDGKTDRNSLRAIVEAWRDSRSTLENAVAAEACYPYGDGTGIVWVPSMPLGEAERLMGL